MPTRHLAVPTGSFLIISKENPMTAVPQVDPRDVPEGATIIDVREDYEWEGGHATSTATPHTTLRAAPARGSLPVCR